MRITIWLMCMLLQCQMSYAFSRISKERAKQIVREIFGDQKLEVRVSPVYSLLQGFAQGYLTYHVWTPKGTAAVEVSTGKVLIWFPVSREQDLKEPVKVTPLSDDELVRKAKEYAAKLHPLFHRFRWKLVKEREGSPRFLGCVFLRAYMKNARGEDVVIMPNKIMVDIDAYGRVVGHSYRYFDVRMRDLIPRISEEQAERRLVEQLFRWGVKTVIISPNEFEEVPRGPALIVDLIGRERLVWQFMPVYTLAQDGFEHIWGGGEERGIGYHAIFVDAHNGDVLIGWRDSVGMAISELREDLRNKWAGKLHEYEYKERGKGLKVEFPPVWEIYLDEYEVAIWDGIELRHDRKEVWMERGVWEKLTLLPIRGEKVKWFSYRGRKIKVRERGGKILVSKNVLKAIGGKLRWFKGIAIIKLPPLKVDNN